MAGLDGKRSERARLRALRRALPPSLRAAESAAAAAVCLELLRSLAPVAVASYAALPDELDLDALHRQLWQAGASVLLPRVVDEGVLAWHRVGGPAQLRPGAFGISEPDPAQAPAAPLVPGTLVLVPGTGFTASGQRLGQGGGFYDRCLVPGVIAVGVGFSCQLAPTLPCEPHDRLLDGLVIAGRLVLAPRRA